MSTSGSGAYSYDYPARQIVHMDGRRWNVTPAQALIYSALDACRGRAYSSERIAESLSTFSRAISPESVRVEIGLLRKRVAPDVIEGVFPATGLFDRPARRGYIVRTR